MTSSIERLFGMSAPAFLAAHWPDRPAVHHGPHHATAADLDSLVADLQLGFAAHACAVMTIATSVAVHVTDREQIITGGRGVQQWHVDDRTHAIAPGVALFVPRGASVRVEAGAESHALAFGFRVPTWLEMVANTLVSELADEPAWRAPAFDTPPQVLTDASSDAIALLAAAPPPKSRAT